MKRLIVLCSLTLAALTFAQPPSPPAPPTPPPAPHFSGMGVFTPPGIPPAVAQKLGIAPEVVKKVRDQSFDANDQLIQFEADLKRAQNDLQRALSAPSPDEAAVLTKLETVTKAELQVRKNRMSLLLRIRALLGPATWEKLQGELGIADDSTVGSGDTVRREVRIIRRANGAGETVTEEVSGPP